MRREPLHSPVPRSMQERSRTALLMRGYLGEMKREWASVLSLRKTMQLNAARAKPLTSQELVGHVNKIAEEEHETMLSLQRTIFPWMPVEDKQKNYVEHRGEWERAFGSMDDPETVKRIDAAAEAFQKIRDRTGGKK